MNDVRLSRLTGVILILTPVAFNIFFTLLSVTFGYPDVIREPTGEVLGRFDAGGGSLVAIWYGFMVTAVLFVPWRSWCTRFWRARTRRIWRSRRPSGSSPVWCSSGSGPLAFLVPYLANVYLDPASSAATRESVAVVFQAFNQYAGVGVGENLGYLFTGLWTVLVAMAMLGSSLPLRRWLGLLGAVSAVGIIAGMFEPAGFGLAADIVVVGYILWSIWLALTGILLLLPGRSGVCNPGYPGGDPATLGGDREL